MNFSKCFLFLLFCCVACSKPVATVPQPVPVPQLVNDAPYKVTALLNGSTWYGTAYASEAMAGARQSGCSSNRFNVGFSTDLPYDNNSSKRPVTGCLKDCVPTQMLGFQNVPLAVGRYEIATLNSCAAQGEAVRYVWLVGGDAAVSSYTSKENKVGWIQVTNYDATQNTVEGSFEVSLSNKDGQMAHFQKGFF